jgi:LytS/YehU family sensor histidine kinase
MVVGLSALLRNSLESASSQQVALDEELRLLGITSTSSASAWASACAWSGRMAPEARAAMVPPLLLQPLVENAVRHGISRRLAPGTLRVLAVVEAGSLCLEVHDDGAGQSAAAASASAWAPRASGLQALYGAGPRWTC